MIGWTILGLVGVAVCAALIFDEPWWKRQTRVWEHEDQLEESEKDRWDWENKQGRYVGRSD